MQIFTRILLIAVLAAMPVSSVLSQPVDTAKLDNNPKLTTAESDWLNGHINRGEFDFQGKYVAFSQLLTGGFYGIGKFMLPYHKKSIFNDKIGGAFYQLYILTDEEKRRTNGYDAILVFGDKKHKGKMRRLTREAVIADNYNTYPQIPAGAGKDDNPVLSEANAAFFNEIYKGHTIVANGFDFSGKKVAIFNTHCSTNKIEQQTIPAYVERVKQSLNEYGHHWVEFTYLLDESQKRESGGYDVIIQYRCKMDLPLALLIKKLREVSQ